MTSNTEHLPLKNGVYLWDKAWDEQSLSASNSTKARFIEFRGLNSKKNWLLALANELEFPDYFAPNFDAFAECLLDRVEQVKGGDGYCLFLHKLTPNKNMRQSDCDILLGIFQECSEEFERHGVEFRVFYTI